jgi:hypothetical protein
MGIVRGSWWVVNVTRGGLRTYPGIEISTNDGRELGLHVVKHPFQLGGGVLLGKVSSSQGGGGR